MSVQDTIMVTNHLGLTHTLNVILCSVHTYVRTYFESPYLNMCISILFVVLDGIFSWLHACMLGLRWFHLMRHSKRHSQILTARDKEETPEIEKCK